MTTHQALLNALIQFRVELAPRPASGKIVIVAIDSHSIEQIGMWPWPRDLHAQLLEKLKSAGAEDVAFDIDFSSPSNAPSDDRFAKALATENGAVILPVLKQVDRDGRLHINRPIKPFSEKTWEAFVNVQPDSDGISRRYRTGNRIDGAVLPSLAVLLAGAPQTTDASFFIDFGIRAIPTVSYADVLTGDSSLLSMLKNKKVIVGGTALELGDRITIPRGQIISGPLFQAYAAESIVQGRALHELPGWLSGAAVILLLLVVARYWRSASVWRRITPILGFVVIAEVGAAILQARAPLIFDTAPVIIVAGAAILATALDEIDILGMLRTLADLRFERIAMSLGDGLVCADERGLITVWNDAAAAIFGYTRAELIGQPVSRILSWADSDEPFSFCDSRLALLGTRGGKVAELRGIRKEGTLFAVEASLSAWTSHKGAQYGAALRDITIRKREAEKIRYLASFDTLTGLANRHTLTEYLEKELLTASSKSHEVALLLFDLDTFKEINDTMGHACGDEILFAVATILQNSRTVDGLVARLGGDEFAVVLVGNAIESQARSFCEDILVALESPIAIDGRKVSVKTSMGLAVFPRHGETAKDLFGNADLALYRAKDGGKGQYVFYDQTFRAELEARLTIEKDLKTAIERNELELFYQPQVDLVNGNLKGAEALIRWRHPEKGFLSPAQFVPIMNRSVLANDVGSWVLESACKQGAAWHRAGHPVRVAVNLSPSQIQSPGLPGFVAAILATTGLPPSLLELEVTEDCVLADEGHALETFREIQALGVRLAFDDFGTGFASMSYLKKFPLDVLKIDKSFVIGLGTSERDMAIVSGMIALGRQLGLAVIAEGVEDTATADLLMRLGCGEGQGYFYGRPMPAFDFEQRFLAPQQPTLPARAASAA
ncbi:MAG TPA: EAL domain-containing protein [Pseudolabrys sp.]|nr:EAL domain-containing protein [Pseudolabrys sp.]